MTKLRKDTENLRWLTESLAGGDLKSLDTFVVSFKRSWGEVDIAFGERDPVTVFM